MGLETRDYRCVGQVFAASHGGLGCVLAAGGCWVFDRRVSRSADHDEWPRVTELRQTAEADEWVAPEAERAVAAAAIDDGVSGRHKVPITRGRMVRALASAGVPVLLLAALVQHFRRPQDAPHHLAVPFPTPPITERLSSTMAAECVRGDCNASTAGAADLAAVRALVGQKYRVSGERITDRHAILRGLNILVVDDQGDSLRIVAVRVEQPPPAWPQMVISSVNDLDVVNRSVVPSSSGVWLVESDAYAGCDEHTFKPLRELAARGGNPDQLHV
jgi:hypothetical protein